MEPVHRGFMPADATAIVSVMAPQSWAIITQAPAHAVWIAVLTGFAWGLGLFCLARA